MYIDNIGQQFTIGSRPCNNGPTGPTGTDGTKYFASYYQIDSIEPHLIGPTGLTEIIVQPDDTSLNFNTIPFQLYNGQWYSHVNLLITGMVYFQPWDIILDGYNAGNPSIPCLFINTHAQNSLQRMYIGYEDNNTKLRIRYEGTNASTGILGEPNIVWELTQYVDTQGQFDIVFGEVTPPISGEETLTAVSTGQGYMGQMNAVSNTAYRIYPEQLLVDNINIRGDGFRTGIKDDTTYVDIEPFYPLVVNDDNVDTTIVSTNLLNIESSAWLIIYGQGDINIRTPEFTGALDSDYYGNIYVNPGSNQSTEGLTFLVNLLVENIPQYNSNSIPTGPEYLVWVDENNYLRVL